ALQYLRQQGEDLPFDQWLLIGVPGSLVLILLTWWILLRVHPPQATRVSLGGDLARLQWSTGTAIVGGGAILTIVGWATGSWHGLPAATVAILPIVAYFGTQVLTLDDLRRLPWDVLLLMGGGLCLGVGISTSGRAGWLASQ